MKTPLLNVIAMSAMLLATLPGSAQDMQGQSPAGLEPPYCSALQDKLDAGSNPEEIVRGVVGAGKTLVEATIYTMVCGGEENRVAVATAGIGLADNLARAHSVANAVLATAGETGPVAAAVRVALEDYASNVPQPMVHQDVYTPTGVSPSL